MTAARQNPDPSAEALAATNAIDIGWDEHGLKMVAIALDAFAAAAVAAERERCAKIAENGCLVPPDDERARLRLLLTETEKRLIVLCLQAVLKRAEWSLGRIDHHQLDGRDWACVTFAKEEIRALIAKIENAP